MSKELKITTEEVMNKIRKGGYKMHPRSYFVLGSVLSVAGLVILAVVSIFFVGLTRFAMRSYKQISESQTLQPLSDFPWWVPLVVIVGLFSIILLLRKYDISYKYKTWAIATVLVVVIFTAGWSVDASGLNEVLVRHNVPVQKIMKQYRQGGSSQYQKQSQSENIQNKEQNKNQGNTNQIQPQNQFQEQKQIQDQPQSQAQGQANNNQAGDVQGNSNQEGEAQNNINNPDQTRDLKK